MPKFNTTCKLKICCLPYSRYSMYFMYLVMSKYLMYSMYPVMFRYFMYHVLYRYSMYFMYLVMTRYSIYSMYHVMFRYSMYHVLYRYSCTPCTSLCLDTPCTSCTSLFVMQVAPPDERFMSSSGFPVILFQLQNSFLVDL